MADFNFDFITVPKFYKYQPDEVHTRPSIQIFEKILDNDDLNELRDRDRWHFVGILLLAHKYKNKIPYDVDLISEELRATDHVNIGAMIAAGLVNVWDEDEIRKEAEKRRQKAIETSEKYQLAERVLKFWKNAKLKPKTVKVPDRVVGMIWQRKKEYGVDGIERVLRIRHASRFLSGGMNIGNGHAAISWVFRPENFEKIISGQYSTRRFDRKDDGWCLDQAAEIRGFQNSSDADKAKFLGEDIKEVDRAAADASVDLSGMSVYESIKWYQNKFGRYPRKETE
jgi:hypothetical protein